MHEIGEENYNSFAVAVKEIKGNSAIICVF